MPIIYFLLGLWVAVDNGVSIPIGVWISSAVILFMSMIVAYERTNK